MSNDTLWAIRRRERARRDAETVPVQPKPRRSRKPPAEPPVEEPAEEVETQGGVLAEVEEADNQEESEDAEGSA